MYQGENTKHIWTNFPNCEQRKSYRAYKVLLHTFQSFPSRLSCSAQKIPEPELFKDKEQNSQRDST